MWKTKPIRATYKFQRQSVNFSFVIINLKENAVAPKITQTCTCFLAASNNIFSKMNAEIGLINLLRHCDVIQAYRTTVCFEP